MRVTFYCPILLALTLGGCGWWSKKPAATPLGPNQTMVEDGERLYDVAYRTNVSLEELILCNALEAPYRIYPGQILSVPFEKPNAPAAKEVVDPSANDAIDEPPDTLPVLSAGQPLLEFSSEPKTLEKPKAVVVKPAEPKTERKTEPKTAPKKEPAPKAKPSTKFHKPTPKFKVTGKFGDGNEGVWGLVGASEKVHPMADGDLFYIGDSLPEFKTLVFVRHPNGFTTTYAGLVATCKKGPVTRETVLGTPRKEEIYLEIRDANKKAINPEKEWSAA